MQTDQPLVSVLMTAYNREYYIGEAIESVLASTYQNFELIIVDDCSTDRTVEIAKHYQNKDSRIKLYVNEKNLGDYPNRNNAARFAKGDYIMYVDSDDKIYSYGIAYCVKEMLEDMSVDMGILCRDENLCGKILFPFESSRYHFFTRQFLMIGPGGTILKRNFFEQIGFYPEKYGPANDMYFNLKVASQGKIRCMCKEFFFYRLHDGQELNNKYAYLYNGYNYMRDALNELDMRLTEKEIHFLKVKNKRRFIVNTFRYAIKTKDIGKTLAAYRRTNFSIMDFINGIFH